MTESHNRSVRLSEPAAAEILCVTTRTLRAWRAAQKGPPFVRIGRKRIMYDESVLHAWVEHQASEGAVRCPSCGGWTSPQSGKGAAP